MEKGGEISGFDQSGLTALLKGTEGALGDVQGFPQPL